MTTTTKIATTYYSYEDRRAAGPGGGMRASCSNQSRGLSCGHRELRNPLKKRVRKTGGAELGRQVARRPWKLRDS